MFDAPPGKLELRMTVEAAGSGGTPDQEIRDLAVGAAGSTHQIDLSLASVPTGEYLIEITVKASGSEVKELVPLRVTS